MFPPNINDASFVLVKPKERDTIWQKKRCDIQIQVGRVGCEEEYIDESGRTFAETYREHIKALSPIHDNHNTTGQYISIDYFSIVGRDDKNLARSIKETIFIRVNDPSLNRNIGK